MKNILNWLAVGCLVLFLLIPTIFSLTWLFHLFVAIPFIDYFWDITIGSMIIGSLGVSMIPSKSEIEKTDEDKKQINFYSGLVNCLVAFNAGVLILSGITDVFSSFDDITYGIYAKYVLMGVSSLLIATAILTAGIHIKRYYKQLTI